MRDPGGAREEHGREPEGEEEDHVVEIESEDADMDVEEDDEEEVADDEEEVGEEDSDDDDDEENDDNPMAHLPQYVIKRIDRLKDLDKKRVEIMQLYIVERAQLEKKYASLHTSLYDDRKMIVAGDKDEEIASGDPQVDTAGEPERVSGIPQFWVCAMTNNDTIGELIAEDDVDCLESLKDVRCVERDDGKGFELFFYFAPNDYFENQVRTRSRLHWILLAASHTLLFFFLLVGSHKKLRSAKPSSLR
jgi:hypothetical protein